jgi:hypothetical protein
MFDMLFRRCIRMTQPSYPNEAPPIAFRKPLGYRIIRIFKDLGYRIALGSQAVSEGGCPVFIPVPDDGCPEVTIPN